MIRVRQRSGVGTQKLNFSWAGGVRGGIVPAGTPPLARITLRDASLSSSQVMRAREKPSARATGRISRSACVA